MEMFRALRDSIQKAHGGKLSQEEIRAEMRKLFEKRMVQGTPRQQQNVARQAAPKAVAQYGIDVRFPEYQKGAYDPTEDFGRGRVWILKSNGLLEPVFVRTGLNDGRYTEILTPKLQPGDQVVLGATAAGGDETSNGSNPLAGGQRMMMR